MSYRPDFTVVSPGERVVLVVEAKAVARTDPRWAAELRHDLVARALLPAAPFFMLALLDQIHVWRDATDPTERTADVRIHTFDALARYLPPEVVADGRMSGDAFELAVFAWLGDLTWGGAETARQPWAGDLAAVGLLDAVRGAEARVEAVA